MRTRLEVLIVAYGPPALLRSAVDSLRDVFPVHVVDNGRCDEVADLAAERGVHYIRPAENIGFSAAVNVGLSHVGPRSDVLLLNPDARIDPEAVVALQQGLHQVAATAAVAPRLRRPDGTYEPTRWPIPTPALPWRGIVGGGHLRAGDEFFLSGAVLLLNGEALQRVGGFDERFFLYAEECDWQRRALAAGFTLREVPGITADHVGAATSSDATARETYFHGSAELFVRKWHGRAGWWVFRAGSLLAALRRALTAKSPGRRRVALHTARLYVNGPASRLPVRTRR